MKFRLSKSKILSGIQCSKRLYLEVHQPDLLTYGPDTEQRFLVGHQVGEAAQQQWPGGHLIGGDEKLSQALEETATWLLDHPDTPLFEATFSDGNVLIRADIFRKSDDGYCLSEVKASTSVKDIHIPDCAVQAHVIETAGYPLARIELAHINNSFIYGGDGNYDGLFHYEDVTDQAREEQLRVPAWVEEFQDILAGAEPAITVGPQCQDPYDCPFLEHCAPPQPEYPVTLLPYDRRGVATKLVEMGITDVRDIPEGWLEQARHEHIRQVTVAGKAALNSAAGETLRALPFPRYYLDFETIAFAVPVWKGTRPYQQLPFQWSCHIENRTGEIDHVEFLDTIGIAPMREFCESLLIAVGDSGPIMVYSHYEKRILNEMSERFPDLSPALRNLVNRLFDLLPLARGNYYHPAMKGSWSIKAVLPTIAPELDYGELGEIQDGTAAQYGYLEMIHPDTVSERKKVLEDALLEYCERDTLALVKVAEYFQAPS